MATVRLEGFQEVDRMFKELGDVPFDVTQEAVLAMADEGEKAVRSTGSARGVRDPESNVHILDKIKHTKVKETDDGAVCYVTFSGSRTRGKTRTRNAEIAFINEYGNRNQTARQFIRQASEQYADAISAPGEKIIGDWQEKVIKG